MSGNERYMKQLVICHNLSYLELHFKNAFIRTFTFTKMRVQSNSFPPQSKSVVMMDEEL